MSSTKSCLVSCSFTESNLSFSSDFINFSARETDFDFPCPGPSPLTKLFMVRKGLQLMCV